MDFVKCIANYNNILMEGALGERLKREYEVTFDSKVAMASLIYHKEGRKALSSLWTEYIDIARTYNMPFIATTPTRRANYERVTESVYTEKIIADNVAFLKAIKEQSNIEMYAGGLVGCKGDAYTGEEALSEDDAYHFHRWSVNLFAEAGVDFLYAGIMPALPEAAGLARAADLSGLPYIISFTIQADGRLIDGTTIADAIKYIDRITSNKPVCYMTNCVHPNIVYQALSKEFNQNELVKERFIGIQANASPLSYSELDNAKDVYCTEPEQLSMDMLRLKEIGKFKIWGGCCGTNCRHMKSIARKISLASLMTY